MALSLHAFLLQRVNRSPAAEGERAQGAAALTQLGELLKVLEEGVDLTAPLTEAEWTFLAAQCCDRVSMFKIEEVYERLLLLMYYSVSDTSWRCKSPRAKVFADMLMRSLQDEALRRRGHKRANNEHAYFRSMTGPRRVTIIKNGEDSNAP